MKKITKVEKIARIICKEGGYDPDYLESGDLPRTDGTCPSGDPGHFLWRDFTPLARKIIKALSIDKDKR